MQDILLTSIPLEQFRTELSNIVKSELQTLYSAIQPTKEPAEFLTRKEAASFLSVSLPTLHEWTLAGKVIGYRIGTRVRYKRAELETALEQIRSAKNGRRAA